jgi:peptidoglycan/LPS O-acetylase OafA/YrhL
MVFLAHGIFAFQNAPGALDHVPGPVLQILGHGWLGVDLFFLLSGFLITGILLDSKDRPRYFRNFYTRRVLRIMPLYFACILVWWFFYTNAHAYFLLSSVFGANLANLFGIPQPKGPDVLWSLAVEEHFYLVWPIVVLLTNRRTLLVVSSLILVLTPCLRAVYAMRGMDPEVIYLLSWFRFDGLAGGALMALWARSSLRSAHSAHVIAATAVVLDIVLSVALFRYGIFAAHAPVAVALRFTQAYLIFGAFFLLAVAHAGSRWTAPLRWRVMQISGALSYCVYLIHLSVGEGYDSLLKKAAVSPDAALGPGGAIVARLLVMTIISFGLAALSRRYFDGPILALKDRVAPVARGREIAPVASEQLASS